MPSLQTHRATTTERGGRRRYAVVAVLAIAALGATACSQVHLPGAKGAAGGASPSPSITPALVHVHGKAHKLSYRRPVRLAAEHGTLTSVTVKREGGGRLTGSIAKDGTSWKSDDPPLPTAHYTAKATMKNAAGKQTTKVKKLHVRTVPPDHRLTFNVTPSAGSTVGIGEPIAVRFTTPVTHKRAVEKAMHVDAKTSSGHSVTGSWHWLSDQEVHWRPKHFYASGTTVGLDMKLRGVKASDSRWGRKGYAQEFTVGSSRVLKVNAKTHMMKVFRNGKHVATWRTGTGRPHYPTRNGTYIVLSKQHNYRMTSCNANITCKKSSPMYYDTMVHWAVRITTSGTFVHAAPWDGLMGRANTSHGCIHLSTAHARQNFQHAKPGDVVIVRGSNKGPQDRVAVGDPGLVDWNQSWAQWKAGSALH